MIKTDKHPYEDQYTLKYLNQGAWVNLRVVNNLSSFFAGQIKRADFIYVVDKVLEDENQEGIKRVQLTTGRFIQVQLVKNQLSYYQLATDLILNCFKSKKD